jgi:hypothetical protein
MKNNVRLIYLGRVKKIRKAVRKANEILGDPEFYNLIRDYKKFGEDLSPEVIASLMEKNNHEIIVRVSYLMPIKVASTRSAASITLSYWNMSNDLAVAVNAIIHETVNAIDHLHAALNKESVNQYHRRETAPWVIGAIAEIMVK